MKGIYKYTDLKTGEVVYVGKDSHIDKNSRHKDHLNPSKYEDQPFNKILQNNADRYEYSIIWATEECTDLKLNKIEILFGKIYNPKFNFDKFGKGGCNGHTEETKKKLSDLNKGENHPKYGKKYPHTEETKRKISNRKNTSGYYRVTKVISKRYKQGFIWWYRFLENGKIKSIKSVDIEKLEAKVKAKGWEWRCL